MFENAKFFTSRPYALVLFAVAALLSFTTGCGTIPDSQYADASEMAAAAAHNKDVHTESIILREGDVLKIAFPGAPNLNTDAHIMRDGNITLPLIGQVRAAGKTPIQLKADLVKLYSGQVESKEMSVEVISSTFPVFVTGAVLRPQKVLSDHPMTALEAVMECGGFDYSKANLKAVTVLRREGSHLVSYTLDFKKILKAEEENPFYMKPGDIIYVKERFTWF